MPLLAGVFEIAEIWGMIGTKKLNKCFSHFYYFQTYFEIAKMWNFQVVNTLNNMELLFNRWQDTHTHIYICMYT
jgi:hypothetical protein